jgi:hypothetical protein
MDQSWSLMISRYALTKVLSAMSLKDHFDRCYVPEPMSGCWLWVNAGFGYGYSMFSHRGYIERSHRASWRIHKGQIPDGLMVCHKCDNPACVNPDHLFLGTNKDNLGDMVRKGRSRRGSRQWKASITEEQAIAIFVDQRPRIKIAEEYGTSIDVVHRIKQRTRWKHIHEGL